MQVMSRKQKLKINNRTLLKLVNKTYLNPVQYINMLAHTFSFEEDAFTPYWEVKVCGEAENWKGDG